LTLLRTPLLPANYASFLVPLNLNKLDLKSYLWALYGLPVLSVRSYIIQQRLRAFKQVHGRTVRLWNRPKSLKKMTVEMGVVEDGRGGRGGGLFVWPDQLTTMDDFEPWDREVSDAAKKEQDDRQTYETGRDRARVERPDRGAIAEQASRLLSGKETWRPSWQAFEVK